jgi:hypothetical protein
VWDDCAKLVGKRETMQTKTAVKMNTFPVDKNPGDEVIVLAENLKNFLQWKRTLDGPATFKKCRPVYTMQEDGTSMGIYSIENKCTNNTLYIN